MNIFNIQLCEFNHVCKPSTFSGLLVNPHRPLIRPVDWRQDVSERGNTTIQIKYPNNTTNSWFVGAAAAAGPVQKWAAGQLPG